MRQSGRKHEMGGVWLVLGAFSSFSISDSIAKGLGHRMSPLAVMGISSTLIVAVLAIVLVVRKGPRVFVSRASRAHLVRAIALSATGVLNFWVLPKVTLAQFYTVQFSAPFFIVLISGFLLKETISLSMAGAVLLGFLGVLVGVGPQLGFENPWLTVMLISPVAFSIGSISARWIDQADSVVLLAFYPKLLAAILLCPWTIHYFKEHHTIGDLGLLGILALCDCFAYIALGRGYQLARAGVLAPLHYVQLLWGLVFGYIFWATVPTGMEMIGAFLVVLAGLLVYRL